jgi:hypothetical protein
VLSDPILVGHTLAVLEDLHVRIVQCAFGDHLDRTTPIETVCQEHFHDGRELVRICASQTERVYKSRTRSQYIWPLYIWHTNARENILSYVYAVSFVCIV